MSESETRLERLISAEIGECCEGDLDNRLTELQELADATPEPASDDRRALKTLGDETRFELVRLLDTADGELCVCELSPLVDVSESAVSHALSDLTDAGLVTRRKEQTWRYYSITDRAEAILDALETTRSGTHDSEVPA